MLVISEIKQILTITPITVVIIIYVLKTK